MDPHACFGGFVVHVARKICKKFGGQYTDWIRGEFAKVAHTRPAAEETQREARSIFGVSNERDWWGRALEWEPIIREVFPRRRVCIGGMDWPPLKPAKFDETISVVNSWLHCTGYGILQRMLSNILRDLRHKDLQAFYVLMDALDRDQTFADAAPKTTAETFYVTQTSHTFKRRVSKMTASYGHLFVAADALEMIVGYQHSSVLLFRDWVGMCTSYLLDMDGKLGGPSKQRWDVHMEILLERSVCVFVHVCVCAVVQV